MASTWSALKIELLETGQNSGTWGTLTNVNLGDAVLGEAITGSATVDFPTDADVTVTLTDSATSQSARNLRLNITESSTGVGSVRSLILGSGCQIEKFYLINNTGTGAKTVKNTTGTGISVPAGKATLVYNNGTNVVDAASYFTSLTLGSALPVASGGTGLTAGTSGGVLAFTATGTLASSAALAASALVIGGGAGAAPSTTATGTGVVTALGVNTGSAGAFVVNGGALGSPASVGTMPAFTLGGTVSGGGNQINNVIIGAVTPLAGAFTTLSATGDTNLVTTTVIGGAGTAAGLTALTVGDATNATFRMAFTNGALIQLATNNSVTMAFGGKESSSGAFTQRAALSSTGLAVTGTLSATDVIKQTGNPSLAAAGATEAFVAHNTGYGAVLYGQGTTFDVALLDRNTTPRLTVTTAGAAVTGTLSATGTLSGGTSGTAYSFSGSAPAGSLTLGSGGTLTAAGLVTSTFDGAGNPWLSRAGATANAQFIGQGNTGGVVYAGIESSVGGTLITGATGYAFVFRSPSTPIQFSANNGASPQMTLDSSGNLGLGVTPTAWTAGGKIFELGFKGNIFYGVTYTAVGFSNNAYYDATAPSGWKFANPTSSRASYYEQSQGTHAWATSTAAGTAGNAISFTQAMTLDASARLSLGTTTASTGFASINLSGGPTGANTGIQFNYNSGAFGGGAITTVNAAGGGMSFYTFTGNVGSESYTERMRLDSIGNFFVNGTTTGFFNKNQISLEGPSGYEVINHVNGTTPGEFYLALGYNGAGIGSITQAGTTGVLYNVTSDYRLKTVIGAVSDSGSRIDALQPIEYTWNSNGSSTRGFLAHQFQEVYASSVTGTKDAVDAEGKPVYQAMQASTSEVIADLVAELQSLRARVAQLESKA